MSLRSFTNEARISLSRRNPDLRPDRFLSARCSIDLPAAAPMKIPASSATGRRCEDATVWSTHLLLVLIAGQVARQSERFPVAVGRLASFCRSLWTDVLVERHLSRIFPCLTRSLASAIVLRPAALRALLFPDSSPSQKRWVPAPEKAPCPWERTSLASSGCVS